MGHGGKRFNMRVLARTHTHARTHARTHRRTHARTSCLRTHARTHTHKPDEQKYNAPATVVTSEPCSSTFPALAQNSVSSTTVYNIVI